MMKKTGTLIIALIFCLSFTSSCSQDERTGKYSDLKTVMDEMHRIFDSYTKAIENVQNPEDLADAMDDFSESLLEIEPELKKLEKKYPELKSDTTEAPEELKEQMHKLEKAMKDLTAAMYSSEVIEYMSSPEVIEASKRFQRAMQQLD